jgi:hypothetical protein
MNNSQEHLYDNYFSMTADILLNVAVISTVLTILFFTIGNKIEKNILEKQVENIVRDVKESPFYQYNKRYFYNDLKEQLDNYKPDDIKDKEINENNKTIFNNTIKLVVIANVLIILILLLLWYISKKMKQDINISYYIFKNIILAICITLTELFFLFYISARYIYVDSNFVYKHILNQYIKDE